MSHPIEVITFQVRIYLDSLCSDFQCERAAAVAAPVAPRFLVVHSLMAIIQNFWAISEKSKLISVEK